MKLYKEGASSRAICSHCKQLRAITFAQRDVPLSSGKGLVRDVLVGVCDTCSTVASIPQQSVPRIKDVVRDTRHSVETRIPRHLLDALGLACHELGFGTESSSLLFRYYLRRAGSMARLRARLPTLAASEEASGPANARFSAKLNETMFKLMQEIERDGVKQSDLVKGLIVQIKKDVLDDKRADVCKELQAIMLLAG